VATARALAQAQGAELVGVSTLRALAWGVAGDAGCGTALAVLDARRGEAFAAAWRGDQAVLPEAALAPTALADAVETLVRAGDSPLLAVGEGALRFRQQLEVAGAVVPPDGDALHRVGARHVCRLAGEAEPGEPETVLPRYLRLPDAEINRRQRQP
jgi:tRNA threonylcarbamoyladenosine biosynthesis protein TsaB